MANRRKDKLCVDLRICISNDLNEAVEKYQAIQKLKGRKLRKPEAAELLFEQLAVANPSYYNNP